MVAQNAIVSIIIPVYNIEKYIERCIISICNQTYKSLEIILVDDGSTDSSGIVCDRYAKEDKRIQVIHKPNGGVSSARNCGLDAANGDYIGFVDGDDYIDADMYNALICQFERSDDIDISIVGFSNESNHGTFQRYCSDEIDILLSQAEQLECLLTNKYFSCSACDKLFRKDLITDIRFDETIPNYEDLLFVYQAMKKSRKAAFSSEPYYFYCTNYNTASTSLFSHKKMSMIDVCEDIYTDICITIPKQAKIGRTELVRNTLMCARFAALDGYDDKKDIERFQRIIRQNLSFFLSSYSAFGYKIQSILLAMSWIIFRYYIVRGK